MLTLLLGFILISPAHAAVNENSSTVPSGPESHYSESTFHAGHNLTPTSDVLAEHQTTVGTYVVGYGITDRLTVATSPFIIGMYNMAMVDVRYNLVKRNDFKFTVEGMYFKSLPYSNLGPHMHYEQESSFLRLTASQKFSRAYTLHVSTGHQYFWNADIPYSLNPNAGQSSYIASVSTLHEFHMNKNFGLFAEAGILGLNYSGNPPIEPEYKGFYISHAQPYLHLGLSVFYETERMLVQIGISRSSSQLYSYWTDSYSSIPVVLYHPEAQLQFYL